MNTLRAAFFLLSFTPFLAKAQSNDLIDLEFGTLETFDVATWNIEWFPKNGFTTLNYVAQIIEELELDVIAIQEIDSDADFQILLNALQGYDGFFQEGDNESLGYIYNNQSVTVNEVYDIFDESNYSNPFPRAPMVMECTFMDGTEFVLINNHFKCCGNGILDNDDAWDEETRRAYASELLKNYMDFHFSEYNLIMLGDLNDLLTDPPANNVFQVYFDDPDHYRFADMAIAEGPATQWSFPSWPSHLDHILISDELFPALENEDSQVATIQVDDFFPGGFAGYDTNVSDHLPVGFKFNTSTVLSARERRFAYDPYLYPNPTSGLIRFSGDFNPTEVQIYDAQGRFIESSSPIDLSRLENGIYTIILSSKEGASFSQRIIVSR